MVIVLDWHHVVIYFLKGKTHFNMASGQLNIMGQEFGNMIPSHIREASSPLAFKNNLEKYFLTQYDST